MSDESNKKPHTPARRGGLGRGLGALIPSGPLPGGASGKGHFWHALDNPPAVDEETIQRTVAGLPRGGQPADAAETDISPGQGPYPHDTSGEPAESSAEGIRGTAVDIHVDTRADVPQAVELVPSDDAVGNGSGGPEGAARSLTPAQASDAETAPGGEGSVEPSPGTLTETAPGSTGDVPRETTGQSAEARITSGTNAPLSSGRESALVDGAVPGLAAEAMSVAVSRDSPDGAGVGGSLGSGRFSASDTGAIGASGGTGGAGPHTPAAVLIELNPDAIRANPKNPRQVFDDDELAELAESIKDFGLLQPIVVRKQADGYELVMGERRLRAAKLAGVEAIPVIVRQTEDDEMLRDALLENIHRVQLHPLEEAAAYQQLIDEFGVTHEELAQRIKRSRPVISNTIRLLKLPARVQNRVAAGVISGSHARALLSLDDVEAQEVLATRIVAEGLSVRATEEAVSLYSGQTAAARSPIRRNRPTAPALGALAEKLSDHFDTRALVQLGRSKGKIVVEFASIDDLERIVAMMAPPLATQRLDGRNEPAGGTDGAAGVD